MASPADTARSIEFLEPSTVLIEWGDDHESLFTHRYLRECCECAGCVDEWTRKPLLDPSSLPANLSIVEVEKTGRYGLNLHFSDGHKTGIYTFRALRRNCPCPECVEELSSKSNPNPDSSVTPGEGAS